MRGSRVPWNLLSSTERAWNPLGQRVPETLENPLGPKRKRKKA
jgi:hypothetical protein